MVAAFITGGWIRVVAKSLGSVGVGNRMGGELSFRGEEAACSICVRRVLSCFSVAKLRPGLKRIPPIAAVGGAVDRASTTLCGEVSSMVGVLQGVRVGGVSMVMRTLRGNGVDGAPRMMRGFSRSRVCHLVRLGRALERGMGGGRGVVRGLRDSVMSLGGSTGVRSVVRAMSRLLSRGGLGRSTGNGFVLPHRCEGLLVRGVGAVSGMRWIEPIEGG